jgi:hypothetical protein
MRVAEVSRLLAFADHDFTHSLVQEIVLVCSPTRLSNVIADFASDLILPAVSVRMLDSLLACIKE